MMPLMRGGMLLLCAMLLTPVAPVSAQTAASPHAGVDRGALVAALCGGAGAIPAAAHAALAAIPQEAAADRGWTAEVASGFEARGLRCAGSAGSFLARASGTVDAVTLAPAVAPDDARTPFPGLRSRGALDLLLAGLTVFAAASPEAQRAAIDILSAHADALPPGFVQAALDRAHDPGVASALRALRVAADLHAPDPAQRIAAILALGARGTERASATLAALGTEPGYAADPSVAAALQHARRQAALWVHIAAALSLLYNGISVGSVLFMSSVGLAIIFGLMGVINLAQGEFITLGAYTAFSVQQALRAVAPGWIGWYPLAAIPVVFAVTALVGVLVELLVVRHLYRRPLMTLLATWAVSLLLTNLIRVTFGTQNLRFETPPYLSGGMQVVGDFLITWNHLGAIVFAVVAFLATAALLRWTNLGLFMRAVTQNRAMAGCVGISTRRTDMLAFGFGTGLAGLGGLALSPIYNVNPTMGTGFVIDSFMVVVLGGVGSLLGTALAALGIGLVNVGIEPFYGAVAAKVIALLLIIALIQWRPEGLIASRGRR